MTKIAIGDPKSVEMLHLVDPLRRNANALPPVIDGMLETSRHDDGNRLGLPAATLAKRLDHCDTKVAQGDTIVMQQLIGVSCNPMCIRQMWRKHAFERQASRFVWFIIGVQEQRDDVSGVTEVGNYIVVSSGCSQPANHGCGILTSKKIAITTIDGERFLPPPFALTSFMQITADSWSPFAPGLVIRIALPFMHRTATEISLQNGGKRPVPSYRVFCVRTSHNHIG